MTKQLEGDLARAVGRPVYQEDEQGARVNYDYALISDRQTQSDASNGVPPSYLVQVVDRFTGKIDVLPQRFRFDAGGATEEARDRFLRERALVLKAREDAINAQPGIPY